VSLTEAPPAPNVIPAPICLAEATSSPPNFINNHDERRRSQRLDCWLEARIRVITFLPEAERGGLICDISEGGLGLHTDLPHKPQTLLAVQVIQPEPEGNWVVRVRVVRARRHPEGGWFLGCVFLGERE
jgi:hypothetical protein